jgi:hypothetical protein
MGAAAMAVMAETVQGKTYLVPQFLASTMALEEGS